MPETLADHLRRATRMHTAKLGEAEVLALGRAVLEPLVRAHESTPPRRPALDPEQIGWDGTTATFADSGRSPASTSPGGELFELGVLLSSLALGQKPQLSWALDGPPDPGLATLRGRAALQALLSTDPDTRARDARTALHAFEAAVSPSASSPALWPGFRGAAERHGWRGSPAARHLRSAWLHACGPVVASPSVASGLVVAPTEDGRLLLLDSRTGRLLEQIPLGARCESSPWVEGSLAFVGTDAGELVAIDLEAGRELWRASLGTLVRSSPIARGEVVYAGAVTGKTGVVAALDAKRGKPLWKRSIAATFSSPALSGSLLLIGADDGRLHALDAATGSPRWEARLSGKVRATPACHSGLVVAGDFKGRLAAFDLEGRSVWTAELKQALYSSAALSSEIAVLGAHDGLLRGVSTQDGSARFEARTGGPVVASPSVAGDAVLAASTDGFLYLVGLDGEIREKLALGSAGSSSSAALDESRAYVGSSRGVHALELLP